MNIWINSCKVLVFTVVVGSNVLAMEKPDEFGVSQSLTPDFIREESPTPPASLNLRRSKPIKKNSRKKSDSQESVDLRGSGSSDVSENEAYEIPALPTPADVNSALRYFGFEDLPRDPQKINMEYDERTVAMCGQLDYYENEPIARRFRDILLLVWSKEQCGVKFYQLLTINHLAPLKSNQELYDQAIELLALVAD